MKQLKRVATIALCMVLLFSYTSPSAHSGRTDSSGGHHDYKNKSGLGDYHYHCGGHPAHLHKNGVCPYTSSSNSSSSSSSSSAKTTSSKTSKYYKASVVKKVQKKLNKLGYDCGKVDGKFGKKTKKAIKKFQKDEEMKVDGNITKKLLKKLKIDI